MRKSIIKIAVFVCAFSLSFASIVGAKEADFGAVEAASEPAPAADPEPAPAPEPAPEPEPAPAPADPEPAPAPSEPETVPDPAPVVVDPTPAPVEPTPVDPSPAPVVNPTPSNNTPDSTPSEPTSEPTPAQPTVVVVPEVTPAPAVVVIPEVTPTPAPVKESSAKVKVAAATAPAEEIVVDEVTRNNKYFYDIENDEVEEEEEEVDEVEEEGDCLIHIIMAIILILSLIAFVAMLIVNRKDIDDIKDGDDEVARSRFVDYLATLINVIGGIVVLALPYFNSKFGWYCEHKHLFELSLDQILFIAMMIVAVVNGVIAHNKRSTKKDLLDAE